MRQVRITTSDGVCPADVYAPRGEGPWPAVLMFMDGQGIRPAVRELAERLCDSGYFVLLPDLFYRSGPYEAVDPKTLMADPELRRQHRERFMAPATAEAVMSDTGLFLRFLGAQPGVQRGPVGVVGYCMGGRFALLAAGTYPDRVAAIASYHGGGLVSDAPSSPHRLAPRIRAEVYVAGASDDPNFTKGMKTTLVKALSAAEVRHCVETYPARHGWVLRDMPVHDPEEAEHHWRTLIPFLDEGLKAGRGNYIEAWGS
ncbi:MAG TPA: dienelactone hydrolase family protein [Caulobacteraceae bacterium]